MTESASSVAGRAVDPRVRFMRTAGSALYTAVNARVLDHVAAEGIKPVTENNAFIQAYKGELGDGVTASNLALAAVANRLSACQALQMPDTEFYETFGIRKQDRDRANRHTFQAGFADKRFPWYFSAGMANVAVQTFVSDGHIIEQAAERLTIGDWADVIGSDWFAKLMQSLAFTANGVYQSFGAGTHHYERHSLLKYLRGSRIAKGEEQVLVTHEDMGAEGEVILSATLNPEIRARLRAKMHQRNAVGKKSAGCPVARHTIRLSRDEVETSPHIQELLSKGIMTIREDGESDMVQLEQPETAIDRTLKLIAWQFREYERLYGTPVVRRSGVLRKGVALQHKSLPALGIFAAAQERQDK